MAIDATIGNNKEFSCIDASSIFVTDCEIDDTLVSTLSLARFKVEPKPSISDFSVSSEFEASSKIELSFMICSETPLMSWLKTKVAADP